MLRDLRNLTRDDLITGALFFASCGVLVTIALLLVSR